MNVSCAVPDCDNPVIGQCQGYDGSCGRYYCRDHCTDGVCGACTTQKTNEEEAERTYQDYLAAVKGLNRDGTVRGCGFTTLCMIVFVIGAGALQSLEMGLVAVLVVGLPIALLARVMIQKDLGKAADGRPGFEDFYKEYQRTKTKDALMTTLGVVGAIAVAGIGAAIAESDRSQRVRDIEEGVRRGMR